MATSVLLLLSSCLAKSNHSKVSQNLLKNDHKLVAKANSGAPKTPKAESIDASKICEETLSSIPGKFDKPLLKRACKLSKVLPDCYSENGSPIFYFDKPAKNPRKGKNILTMSLIHGDEGPAGTVTRAWMSRLVDLESRNSWRVIPIVNPDGFKNKTRTNANKVDVNRNFPTSGWSGEALHKWKTVKRSDPRKFPGPKPASEKETQCLLKHFEDFQPNFIISVHTPLGVLDFDGPKKLNFPRFSPLPWISLGNFPGSLGRYMWQDNNVPVLTIELNGARGIKKLEEFDRLQDISGTVAIQSHRYLERKKKESKKKLLKKSSASNKEIAKAKGLIGG